MFKYRRKDCKLLPHTNQILYGLSSSSAEILPWSIKKFDLQKCWNICTGNNIKVAIIDTGCDLYHDDLKNNIIEGINIINPSKPPQDDNGHGTHVAGTIAASKNNIGMVGISPDSKIMPIKVLDKNGSGSTKDVSDCVIWAVDHDAYIITMSLGSSRPEPALENAIKYAYNRGVHVFCAAGNSGNSTDIMYPAKYKNTFSIGAINSQLQICYFSCCGDSLDFLAPGEDILSCFMNNSYSTMSGTSMAAPFAAGCAALFLSHTKKKISKIDLMTEFALNTIKLNGEYRGQTKYEGYGIIQPLTCKRTA